MRKNIFQFEFQNYSILFILFIVLSVSCRKEETNIQKKTFFNDGYINLSINESDYIINNLTDSNSVGQTGFKYPNSSDTIRIGREIHFHINENESFTIKISWLEKKSLLDATNYYTYLRIEDLFKKLKEIDFNSNYYSVDRYYPHFELNYRFPLQLDDNEGYLQNTKGLLTIESIELIGNYIAFKGNMNALIETEVCRTINTNGVITYQYDSSCPDFAIKGNFKAWLSSENYLYQETDD